MPEAKSPHPTDWTPEEKDKFEGLRGKYYPALMRQKAPGLFEKLTNIKTGEVPNFTPEEREFLAGLIVDNDRYISNTVGDVARKIWGASGVEWTEDGKRRVENIMAALWWHFNANDQHGRALRLIDFYMGTTKEQAEAEIATWNEWKQKERTNIKLYR